MADYYRDHPLAVPNEVPGRGVNEVEKEDVVVPKTTKTSRKTKAKKEDVVVEAKTEETPVVENPESKDDWVEDDDGNFVKKGD